MGSRRIERGARAGGWIAIAVLLGACASRGPDVRLIEDVEAGEFGHARSHLRNTRSRDEFTDLMHLGMVNLADGLAPESEAIFSRVFEILRLRGVNEGTRLAAVVTHEGVRVFRGEPFEQAMAYHYVALQRAIVGDWGNVRAAAIGGLELLDEFDDLRYGRSGESAGGFEYAVQEADFALGYLMAGLGALGLGRDEEAADFFARARGLNDRLGRVTEPLLSGEANGVVVVDYGLGPIKLGEGSSGAMEVFRARTASDSRRLIVASIEETGGGERRRSDSFEPAEDLNELSGTYTWDDLRDVRAAKALLGDALLAGGAVVAVSSDDDAGALIGIGLMGLGLLSKATAVADTRQIDTLPQRVYLAPVRLPARDGSMTLSVEGDPGSLLRLPIVRARGEREDLRVMYVRLLSGREPADWARSGEIWFISDWSEPAVPTLPYVLGGRDVRTPSERVTADYHAAGLDPSWTTADVLEMYRREGIRVGTDGSAGRIGRHILEGGSWLFSPTPESTGFVRLFARREGDGS